MQLPILSCSALSFQPAPNLQNIVDNCAFERQIATLAVGFIENNEHACGQDYRQVYDGLEMCQFSNAVMVGGTDQETEMLRSHSLQQVVT